MSLFEVKLSGEELYSFSPIYLEIFLFLIGLCMVGYAAYKQNINNFIEHLIMLYLPAKIWTLLLFTFYMFVIIPISYSIDGGEIGVVSQILNLFGKIFEQLFPYVLIFYATSKFGKINKAE
jgi:hypothetical protein